MPLHYLCLHQCHLSKVVDAACLAAGPAGHAGVTAATVLSEGRGWHEDKMLNVAADVLMRVLDWWTARPPTGWCQVTWVH